MTTDNKQAFREKFCKTAAELGVCPSELASLLEDISIKQANLLFDAADSLKNVGITSLAGAGLGGAALGGLGAYLYNQAKSDLDPDNLLAATTLSPSDEAKALHLMAKYRDAIRELKYSLKNTPMEQ